jgi:NAD(P) transhydrogenase subunit alpha
MNIVVLRETQKGEARVALMPESVKKLVALKASVLVESGAGLFAARTDEEFREAGAEISLDRSKLLSEADVPHSCKPTITGRLSTTAQRSSGRRFPPTTR